MNIGFTRNIKKGVVYYSVPSFDETGLVLSAFSTTHGGVSTGKQASMNLGFYSDISMDNVRENFRIFGDAVGFDIKNVVVTRQIHDNYVHTPFCSDAGKMMVNDDKIVVADGQITDSNHFVLSKLFADCVPIYLFDPCKRVISLLHAGWRGTLKDIVSKGILRMVEDYGCNVNNILAAIGPSIGPCCFEVDKPVADLFLDFENCVTKKQNDKYLVDLWRISYLQMIRTGIKDANITISELCTYCKKDDFFSYRREKGETGRMVGFLKLK